MGSVDLDHLELDSQPQPRTGRRSKSKADNNYKNSNRRDSFDDDISEASPKLRNEATKGE